MSCSMSAWSTFPMRRRAWTVAASVSALGLRAMAGSPSSSSRLLLRLVLLGRRRRLAVGLVGVGREAAIDERLGGLGVDAEGLAGVERPVAVVAQLHDVQTVLGDG